MGIKALIDEDLSVSKKSYQLIKTLAEKRTGSNNQIVIFLEPILSTLKEMLQVPNDALKLRVLELMVDISTLSQQHLENVAKEGFLKGLFEDLKKDEDVLVQLNAIEILSKLIESKEGYDYLKSIHILTEMDVRLNSVSSSSLAHFLVPGYVKFFGRLAYHNPKNFEADFPNFRSILSNMLNNDQDQEQQILALEVFGHISLTQEGKKFLLQKEEFFNVLRRKIKSGTSQAKVRSLDVFSDVIRETEENQDDSIAKELFLRLDGENTMNFITEMAKKPFFDLSNGAFNVLVGASNYSWGIEMMKNIAGFFEFLLDRSTAKDKETKDRKYSLISAICAQKEIGNLIPPEVLRQLTTFVKQGPCYVESTVEVAIDEQ